ncbi:hypothetical protein GJ496_003728, partial [Pomphorhynchus laevis]
LTNDGYLGYLNIPVYIWNISFINSTFVENRNGSIYRANGLQTPVYVDMRLIVSYPDIMLKATELIKSMVKSIDFDIICGVPYAAVPIATATSLATNKPLILHRREVKTYGTGRRFEGDIAIGKKCLLMEDVIVAGSSIIESALHLKAAGICVSDAIVLLDREQGGDQNLKSCNINVHSLLKISDVLRALLKMKKIKSTELNLVIDFLANNQVQLPTILYPYLNRKYTKIPMLERSEYSKNLLTKQLLSVAGQKRANLCIDVRCVNCFDDIRRLIECSSSLICVMIINPLNIRENSNIQELRSLANTHNILLCSTENHCVGMDNGTKICNGSVNNHDQWSHMYLIDRLDFVKMQMSQPDKFFFLLDLNGEDIIEDSLIESAKHRLVGFCNSKIPHSTRSDLIYMTQYKDCFDNATSANNINGDSAIDLPWDMFIVTVNKVTSEVINNLKSLGQQCYNNYESFYNKYPIVDIQ